MFNFTIEGSEVVTLEYKSMYHWLKDVTCTCFPPSAPYLGLAAASKRGLDYRDIHSKGTLLWLVHERKH